MGTIAFIYHPEFWKTLFTDENKQDILYYMEIGKIDAFFANTSINLWISKFNYEKILSKDYQIEKSPYDKEPICIFDQMGNRIPPVIGKKIKTKTKIR